MHRRAADAAVRPAKEAHRAPVGRVLFEHIDVLIRPRSRDRKRVRSAQLRSVRRSPARICLVPAVAEIAGGRCRRNPVQREQFVERVGLRHRHLLYEYAAERAAGAAALRLRGVIDLRKGARIRLIAHHNGRRVGRRLVLETAARRCGRLYEVMRLLNQCRGIQRDCADHLVVRHIGEADGRQNARCRRLLDNRPRHIVVHKTACVVVTRTLQDNADHVRVVRIQFIDILDLDILVRHPLEADRRRRHRINRRHLQIEKALLETPLSHKGLCRAAGHNGLREGLLFLAAHDFRLVEHILRMMRRRIVFRIVCIRKQCRRKARRAVLHARAVALRGKELCRADRHCHAVLNIRGIQIDIARRELELLIRVRLVVKLHRDVLVRHIAVQKQRTRNRRRHREALVSGNRCAVRPEAGGTVDREVRGCGPRCIRGARALHRDPGDFIARQVHTALAHSALNHDIIVTPVKSPGRKFACRVRFSAVCREELVVRAAHPLRPVDCRRVVGKHRIHTDFRSDICFGAHARTGRNNLFPSGKGITRPGRRRDIVLPPGEHRLTAGPGCVGSCKTSRIVIVHVPGKRCTGVQRMTGLTIDDIKAPGLRHIVPTREIRCRRICRSCIHPRPAPRVKNNFGGCAIATRMVGIGIPDTRCTRIVRVIHRPRCLCRQQLGREQAQREKRGQCPLSQFVSFHSVLLSIGAPKRCPDIFNAATRRLHRRDSRPAWSH